MPQKKRGHAWSRSKAQRKRSPKPEYKHPLRVRDWISICHKSLRLVKQCFWNHPNMWDNEAECDHGEEDCKYWQKYKWFIKNRLYDLSTLDPDSIPSPELFIRLTNTHVSVLCKNDYSDLNFSLFSRQKSKKYPKHFI